MYLFVAIILSQLSPPCLLYFSHPDAPCPFCLFEKKENYSNCCYKLDTFMWKIYKNFYKSSIQCCSKEKKMLKHLSLHLSWNVNDGTFLVTSCSICGQGLLFIFNFLPYNQFVLTLHWYFKATIISYYTDSSKQYCLSLTILHKQYRIRPQIQIAVLCLTVCIVDVTPSLPSCSAETNLFINWTYSTILF